MSDKWEEAIQRTKKALDTVERVNESSIDVFLRAYADSLGLKCDGEKYNDVFRQLRDFFMSKIPEGTTLTDEGNDSFWEEWLPEMKESDQYATMRWLAYQEYLRNEQEVEYVSLQSLNRSTDTVLGLLSDPRKNHPAVQRKGLILGDVQSGKTRTYMALMNKAVDYGYKMIIVLTSSDENLRKQTQDRINSDFVGYNFSRKSIGIGRHFEHQINVIPITNEEDFNTANSNAYSSLPRPTWENNPAVAVMKKNSVVLTKFNKWFSHTEIPEDLPVLIIDDESDYASVNSAKAEDSPTRINSLICELCKISTRTSYVAVTATPFANVFIDDEVEEDLFPRDFIHILPTPPEYIGAKKLFGDLDNPVYDNLCVRELEWDKGGELDSWLPLTHKKGYKFLDNELDPQIKRAVDCFLIACALRTKGEKRQQSMLVHMSRFTDVQQQIADMVSDYVRELCSALDFHSSDAKNSRIAALRKSFEEEYFETEQANGMTWNTVLQKLRKLTGRLQVRLVNSDSSDWNYKNMIPSVLMKDECTIYVGGNQLSRGMTLNGLICSVFYRNVTSADTLLQMGRWFGYRSGYDQLQRIWLLNRSIDDFRYACSIVEDIKDTAMKMARNGMTPKQFGISILRNPECGVRITNPNKMRNATKTDGILLGTYDLSNRIIESVKLSVDESRTSDNDAALDVLIRKCLSDKEIIVNPPENSTQMFRQVPGEVVSEFLSKYRAGYSDTYFGPTLMRYKNREPLESNTTMMAQFARSRQDSIPETTWTVAFMNGERGDIFSGHPFVWKESKRTSIFDDEDMLWKISGGKLRLAGSTDVADVIKLLHPDIAVVKKPEREYYRTKYFGEDPVLMLYRVHAQPRISGTKYDSYVPADGHGLLGVKVIVPTDDLIDKDQRKTHTAYYSNTVATRTAYERLRRQREEDLDEWD